jgi:hypothetical protein
MAESAAWSIDEPCDTPRKAAHRSHLLVPLVVVALIGSLGGCAYEPDNLALPSASPPTVEPANESSTVSATPGPSISRYHGRPGSEVHETPEELRTMLEDLLRLSARALTASDKVSPTTQRETSTLSPATGGTRAARRGPASWRHAG